ncbi:hypothetical protein PENSPDRAFT_740652 [Peniophora sp. CONT]|nr:hypothetical protein PENSPDRAFT_740652 [Peniophora sp. CONT]
MDYDLALQDAPADLDSPQFHGFLPPSQPAPFGFSPQQNASALQAFAPPPTPTVISPRTALGDLGMTRFMGANPVEEVTSSGPTRTPHDSPRASPYRRNSSQRTRARWNVPLPENAVASSSRLPDMPRAPTQASRRLPDTASPESFEPQYSARGSNLPPIASTSRRSPSLPVEGEMEVDELVAPPAAPTHAIISLPGTPFDGRCEIREDAPGLDLQEGGALGLAVGDEDGSDGDEDDLTSHTSGDDAEADAPQAALSEAAGNAVASSSRLPEIQTLEIEGRDIVVDATASGPLEPPRAPRQAPLSLLGSPEHESFGSQYSAPRSDTPPVASTSNLLSSQAVENFEDEEMEDEEEEEGSDVGSVHQSLPAEQASVHSMSDMAGSDFEDEVEVEAPHGVLARVAYAIASETEDATASPNSDGDHEVPGIETEHRGAVSAGPEITEDFRLQLQALAATANRPMPDDSTVQEIILALGGRITQLQNQVDESQEQSAWVQAQLDAVAGSRPDDHALRQHLTRVVREWKKIAERTAQPYASESPRLAH